jgi:Methyltransferase domain
MSEYEVLRQRQVARAAALAPLEPRLYDLVHCRALLCHLHDPAQALRTMAAAVRPGGWLLVEDADYVSLVAADPAHPRSPRFDAVMRKLLAFIAAGRAFDPFFGRRLPGLVAAAGLTTAGHEATACHRRGRSAAAEVLARSLKRTRDRALRAGAVGGGEFQAVLAALHDPSFSFVDALSVAAWGRVSDQRRTVTLPERLRPSLVPWGESSQDRRHPDIAARRPSRSWLTGPGERATRPGVVPFTLTHLW